MSRLKPCALTLSALLLFIKLTTSNLIIQSPPSEAQSSSSSSSLNNNNNDNNADYFKNNNPFLVNISSSSNLNHNTWTLFGYGNEGNGNGESFPGHQINTYQQYPDPDGMPTFVRICFIIFCLIFILMLLCALRRYCERCHVGGQGVRIIVNRRDGYPTGAEPWISTRQPENLYGAHYPLSPGLMSSNASPAPPPPYSENPPPVVAQIPVTQFPTDLPPPYEEKAN